MINRVKNRLSDMDMFTFWECVIRVLVIAFLFYKNIIFCGIAGIFACIWGVKAAERACIEKKRKRLETEFRVGLTGIASALNAGYAMENAFAESKKELVNIYGNGSVLAREFDAITKQIEMNVSVEKALSDFADRSGVEDIKRYSDILYTAMKTGGDIISITNNTAARISEKIEVHREIDTLIAGKRMEAKIMYIIPLVIILYFWLCSPGFMDALYAPGGRLVMTVFLVIYFTAYIMGEKICSIEI